MHFLSESTRNQQFHMLCVNTALCSIAKALFSLNLGGNVLPVTISLFSLSAFPKLEFPTILHGSVLS